MKYLWGGSWSSILLDLDMQTGILRKAAIYCFLYSPLVVSAWILFKQASWLDIMGLKPEGGLNYLWASLLCCVPMFAGYAYLSNGINASIAGFIIGALYAGFFEEVIFRAVLFGVLFRYCRLGFIPAALVSATVFGLGHIYQGNDPMSAFFAFAITAVAGTWFAWLYCECDYRIWFPMWMHIFMNGAYNFFGMSGGAVGQLEANIFKALAIVLSLVYVNLLIKKGKSREVTLKNLWCNKNC